jgi:hypothetical protein
MRRSRRGGFVSGFAVLALALTIGCGSDRHGSPGPGGATFTGTVSSANTASVARLRSTWLAWLGEHVLGFARPAYAQARDISLGGITVIVRGGGREVSDLTDSSGGFVVSDAPTGEVSVLFRRGSCEGSLPIGGVVSTSTLTLVGVSFLCSPGSDVATVSLADLGERFNGVTRDNPSDQSQVRLCTRVGNDDVLRTISVEGADIFDTGGSATTFADLEEHDLLQIDGFRSGTGSSFAFDTQRVQVKEHNVTDECAGV